MHGNGQPIHVGRGKARARRARPHAAALAAQSRGLVCGRRRAKGSWRADGQPCAPRGPGSSSAPSCRRSGTTSLDNGPWWIVIVGDGSITGVSALSRSAQAIVSLMRLPTVISHEIGEKIEYKFSGVIRQRLGVTLETAVVREAEVGVRRWAHGGARRAVPPGDVRRRSRRRRPAPGRRRRRGRRRSIQRASGGPDAR